MALLATLLALGACGGRLEAAGELRALARAHGGDATAENLAPTGARVTVTLPVVPRPRAVEPAGA